MRYAATPSATRCATPAEPSAALSAAAISESSHRRPAPVASRARLAAGLLLIALTPLAAMLPALATLAVLAAVLCALVGWETHSLSMST